MKVTSTSILIMAQPVTRSEVMQLMKRRDTIDEHIQALGQILRSNNIGMTESLIDNEGYPRNDIDVYQVRHARHQIICLQNDFKQLTKEIESKLEALHQNAGANGTPMEDGSRDFPMEEDEDPKSPIARVNLVNEGSPAFHAGLQVDDLILTFGSLDSSNFQSINDIGVVVQRSRGNMVPVTVRRLSRTLRIALIPGEWSGRGLLGCNVVPYEPVDR